MTRYGLIADIHSGTAELNAALEILENSKVDFTYHLGDLVIGEKPPNDVIALLVRKGIKGVMGRHDEIELRHPSGSLSEKSRRYLKKLPAEIILEDRILLVHDNPLRDSAYVRDRGDARIVFEVCEYSMIIIGHTHAASAFSDSGEGFLFERPGILRLNPSRRYILNPGAVRAPRDGDSSSLGVYDTEEMTFEIKKYTVK